LIADETLSSAFDTHCRWWLQTTGWLS